jgi:transposase
VSSSVSSRGATARSRSPRTSFAALVQERGSSLPELTGIGPTGAARLLADVGDIHRFRDKDRFAS